MISVAMATYNGERFIEEQLNSMKNQILAVDEVVICDDCSSDHTVQIIQNFIKKYELHQWVLVQNKTNIGYVRNFFKAIKMTKGDIIFLADQDDVWLKNKTLEMYRIMEQNSIPMLHSAIDIIDEKDKLLYKNHHNLKEGLHKLDCYQYCKQLNYCGMSSVFTASIRDELSQVDLLDAPTHDWVIGLIASFDGGFYVVDTTYTQRRWHGANEALNFKDPTRENSEERIKCVEQYQRYYTYGLSVVKKLNGNKKNRKILEHYVSTSRKRVKFLKAGQKIKLFGLYTNLRYFPSAKAYVCDLLYAFHIFKFIRR